MEVTGFNVSLSCESVCVYVHKSILVIKMPGYDHRSLEVFIHRAT